MILDINDQTTDTEGRQEIDLTGPNGNAFALLGFAKRFCKQLDREVDPVLNEMRSLNYDNLVAVFEREFGDFVVLRRRLSRDGTIDY